jgi:CO/xanthine dehydrogenase FAD-binding subunit
MKPAAFEYLTPGSVQEAVGLLDKYGDEAKLLAGGQSLVPMLNFRLVRPKYLIDINTIPDLSYIKETDGKLVIGGMTRHRTLEFSPLIRKKYGLFLEAIRLIGHPAIRTRGTIGGSIVHADPTAELPTLLVLLDGEVQMTGPKGKRSIGWRDFYVTYFTTTAESNEMCTEVTFNAPPANAGTAFEEFAHRHGDFGIIGVAVVVEADAKKKCTNARIAVAGGGPIPVRATAAESFLKGKELTAQNIKEAGQKVSGEVDPDSDLHASAEFRRHLASVMTERALTRAVEQLRGDK